MSYSLTNSTTKNNNIGNNALPALKALKQTSATMSYCKHTHIKIAIGTHFHNAPMNARLTAMAHPVFALAPLELIPLLSYAKTPTERYLAMTALLVNTNLIDTTRSGLYLEDAQSDKAFNALVKIIKPLTRYITNNNHGLELPTLLISKDNWQDGSRLAVFLKEISRQLHLYYGANPLSQREKQREKLEDELALEVELNKILNKYNPKAGKYNAKLGQWALRQMLIKNEELEDKQLTTIRHYLNSTNIERLNVGTLQKVIKLAKDSLPYEDDTREQSLLVIRHLESKLETINNITASMGFILLEEEKQHNRKANVEYTTKTKVTDIKFTSTTIKVTNTKPQGGTALERMLAKFK